MPNLSFDILARDRNAAKTFDKVGKSADQAGKKFGHLGARTKHLSAGMRTGFGAAATAIGAIASGALLKSFVDEAREAGKVTRITANAIRATGGAANITAKQVGRLAERISNKTAIDDEAIQKGANLLLTFKNVANEAGKGSKIFDRATTAAVDLSAAGFGSIEGASKMLGKALNDPLKGLTALSKAGVTFTAGQKKQIETLVESGKTLEAQKIILKEVESQVGGAAKAAADPMQRLGVVVDNVKERIGTALLPWIEKAANWLGEHLPVAIEKAGKWIKENLVPAFAAIWEKVGPLVEWAWENLIQPALEGIGWAISNIPDALQWLHETWTIVWTGVGKLLATVGIGILKTIRVVVNGVLDLTEVALGAMVTLGLASTKQLLEFQKMREGVDTTFGGAINTLNDWRAELRTLPRVVELEGDISDLDRKIKDAEKEIKDVPKNKRTEFKGRIADLQSKRRLAQQEIDKLEGKTVKVGLAGLDNINKTFNLLKGLGSSEAGGLIPGPKSERDNHLRMMATGEYVVRARRVDHKTLPILEMINQTGMVPEGYAKGGLVDYRGAKAMPQIESYARQLRMAMPSIVDIIGDTATKLVKNAFGFGGSHAALAFARAQAGEPYVWGGVGPYGWDCSGFMSGILNVIQGRNPYSRRGSTGTFPWSGFAPGPGKFMIGSRRGNPGHMAGTLLGVNVESRGGDGVVVGPGARGAMSAMFTGPYHLQGFAKGGLVGDPPFDLLDPRGRYFNPYADIQWFGNGGVIPEPVIGMGVRSGRRYGFGERGPEKVTPLSGGGSVQTMRLHPDDMERLSDKIAEKQVRKLSERGKWLAAIDSGQRASLMGRAG